MMHFEGKKVLVMGLGVLGGGVATVKWLLRHGARVTVTDTRTRKELAGSIKALGNAAKKVHLVLGGHRRKDFEENDVIVVNPAVRRESEYLILAKKRGKPLMNDARIFFNEVENPIIAVTGTRGKTTTTNWIAHFLRVRNKKIAAAGNSSSVALLDLADRLDDKKTPAVVELSSWQLEFLAGTRRAPDVAVITNLYPDHLNRYKSIREYAMTKANIFGDQKKNHALVLNYENPWTSFFLNLKRNPKVYFFSRAPLPAGKNGMFLENGSFCFRDNGSAEEVISSRVAKSMVEKGEHNLMNFMAAALAAHLMGVSWFEIAKAVKNLPQIKYREEVVFRKSGLRIINDSAATSPDAVIAAIRRFKGEGRLTLIAGGTDKNLDFKPLAREIGGTLPPEDVFFLNGSATKKLLAELKGLNYFKKRKPQVFEDLESILKKIKTLLPKPLPARAGYSLNPRVILFSPGAASFEKFKNEFDRGEVFNKYVMEIFK